MFPELNLSWFGGKGQWHCRALSGSEISAKQGQAWERKYLTKKTPAGAKGRRPRSRNVRVSCCLHCSGQSHAPRDCDTGGCVDAALGSLPWHQEEVTRAMQGCVTSEAVLEWPQGRVFSREQSSHSQKGLWLCYRVTSQVPKSQTLLKMSNHEQRGIKARHLSLSCSLYHATEVYRSQWISEN